MSRTRLLLLLTLVAFGILMATSAQCSFYLLENEYIWAKLGIADVTSVTPPIQPVPARFLFGTTGGDPETTDDDGFSEPRTDGPSEAMVDDGLMNVEDRGHPEGMFGAAIMRIQDVGKDIVIGDDTQGSWAKSPSRPIYPQEVLAQWNTSLGNDTDGTIRTYIKFDLRRDMCRMEYTLKNMDTVPHRVGLRLIWNVYAKTTNFVTSMVPGYGTVDLETDFRNLTSPEYVDFVDDRLNAALWVRNLTKTQSGVYSSDATAPSRIVVGDWPAMAGTNWDYTIDPIQAVTDRGVSIWWDPITLSANQTRTIVTYYGVGVATSDLRSPYVLSVQAPRTMDYDESQSTGLGPDPFDIKAYLYNYLISQSTGQAFDVKNVTLFLTLPKGLALAPGETPAKTLASIGGLREGKVSWSVVPTGGAVGDLTFSVTASGGGLTSKTVRRTINVPQTKNVPYISGLQMVSLPFEFSDPDPWTSLGLPPGAVSLYRYDPATNAYYSVDALVPGEAFWMRTSGATQVTLAGGTPLPGDVYWPIPLYTGWNQFGNPYVYNIQYARIQVLRELADPNPVSIDEATRRGWIRPTLYWYDTFTKAYTSSSSRTTQLVPCRGYWIKALAPCKLMIPPIDQFGSSITTSDFGGGGSGPNPLAEIGADSLN